MTTGKLMIYGFTSGKGVSYGKRYMRARGKKY